VRIDDLTTEEKLLARLRLVEALHAGAATEGERRAAAEALRRLRARLRVVEREDPAVEHRFRFTDPWSRRLFLALLARHDIRPYRRRGQRRTTVTAQVSRRFVEEVLWPEYLEHQRRLHPRLEEAAASVIAEAIGRR
jgi:hypothetical protein